MSSERPLSLFSAVRAVVALTVLFAAAPARAGSPDVLPFVKQARLQANGLTLNRLAISTSDPALAGEAAFLREQLAEGGCHEGGAAATIRLELVPLDLPERGSRYARQIQDQAYRLRLADDVALVQGRTPAAVFYGVQTLLQLVDEEGRLPAGEILDLPDLAFRGIMIDPARANENADYYRRLIRFCARYKLNRLHVHLTDDQNVCLYHEDYAPLLHPHAWRAEQLAPLVTLARRHHIELVPEIESLGHARVFLRHPDFRSILHQTTREVAADGWTGTARAGYTNVLCPASPLTYEYLEKIYARAARSFDCPELHIGCDEVDVTSCARCAAAFPGLSHAGWFTQHVLRCRQLLAAHERRLALWGDMLLQHREIAASLPAAGTIIYDWHYGADVSNQSVLFFKQHDFEVVACPALMCWPRMILPAKSNYLNIGRFTAIARQHDLRGVNTTIWIPTRYLSDALWPGIGYAAVHAWSGSDWNEDAFYRRFAADYFGSPAGDTFAAAWQLLAAVDWPLGSFQASCWHDEASLARAAALADTRTGAEARQYLTDLKRARGSLAAVQPGVNRAQIEFQALARSAAVLEYVLQHFLASARVARDGQPDTEFLRHLDAGCVEALDWIESDWNRNRFADDPDKADRNRTGQHLLDHFRRMHAYHQERLSAAAGER